MEEFKAFAANVMGMADEEIAALYDADGNILPEAFKTFTQKDKERIKRLKEEHKEDLTSKFNEGHAKAKREERSRFEGEIKEAFGVESNATGVDLVKDAIAKGQSGDVKTHPDYLALEKKLQGEYVKKEDFDVVKGEYDTFRQQVEREKVYGRVKEDARRVFHSLNPVLSEDKTRAMNQEKDFLSKVERYGFQLQDDGNHVVLGEDGKRLTNENMNPVAFTELVKNLTLSHFDVREQEPAENSGVDKPPQAGTQQTFKTAAEFYKAYANEGDPAKAVAMMERAKQDGVI